MFTTLALLTTAGILAWIIRYRIHIHIYGRPARRRRRAQIATPRRVTVHPPATMEGDVISALIHLGCTTRQARKAAQQAGERGGFDESLRRAIELARKA